MNVVVDTVVTVLQVLAFGDAVGRDQDVDVLLASRHKDVSVLGNRREAGQNVVKRSFEILQSRLPINCPADHAGI